MLAPPAPQKFKTPSQIRERLTWLNAQNFAKGERGIGSSDHEKKVLQRRLEELMNPQFGEINQPPLI